MIRLLFFVLLAINFIYAVLNLKSNIIIALTYAGTFLIFGGNTMSVDYVGYEYAFNRMAYSEFEPGYVLFCTLVKKLGFTYQGVVVIWEILLLALITYLIVKIKGNFHIFFFAFLCFEQFMGNVQTRSFLASVFLAIAVVFMGEKKRWTSVLLTLAAMTVHSSIGIFLPFFLFYGRKMRIRNIAKIALWLMAGVLLLLVAFNYVTAYNPLSDMVYQILYAVGSIQKARAYSGTTRFGALLYALFYFANVYTVYFMQRKIKRERGIALDGYDRAVMAINLYVSMFLPFLAVSTVFYRFYRLLNIANYAYCSSILQSLKKPKFLSINLRSAECLLCLAGNCALWAALHIYFSPGVYSFIFENNMFIHS